MNNKKYEIVIKPEDDQFCGGCTYKTRLLEYDGIYGMTPYGCMLFDKPLSNNLDYEKVERCGDCKILIERFIKMPELEEEY